MHDSFDIYWSVNSKRTYSKLEALMLANGQANQVSYHWMENTWDHVDFSQEPTESWNDLCRLRAEQIRDTHDWVCLWFSGGYDSSKILETFISAGILVDEIAVFDQRSFYDDGEVGSSLAIAEHYRTHYNSNVKITHIDLGWDYIRSRFLETKDWLLQSGDNLRFTRAYFGDRRDQALHQQTKSLTRADVVGFEKPKMDIYQGQWRTFMPDGLFGCVTASGATQFYCSHSMPKLHVKQIHMAIRFFESHNIGDLEKLHKFQSFGVDNSDYWYQEYNLALGRTLPKNPASAAGVQKFATSPTVLAPKDQLILNHAHSSNDKSFQIYRAGIEELRSVMDNWDPWSTDAGANSRLPTFCSKFYPVKPVKQN